MSFRFLCGLGPQRCLRDSLWVEEDEPAYVVIILDHSVPMHVECARWYTEYRRLLTLYTMLRSNYHLN